MCHVLTQLYVICAGTTSFLYEVTPLQQTAMFDGRTHLQTTVPAKQLDYSEADVFLVANKVSSAKFDVRTSLATPPPPKKKHNNS